MKLQKLERYAPLLLRTGIAVVFLWFGFTQLKSPDGWTRMLPAFTQSLGVAPTTLIYMNGIFEIVFASLLLLGLFTRTVSLILSLHLFHITYLLGYGAVAARDFSLAIATLSIFFKGKDEFSLDSLIFGRKERYDSPPHLK